MESLKNFEGDKFLKDLTGFSLFSDGFLEVVTDYRRSKYFAYNEMQDAYDFATQMASEGHDIHFGPAVRKNDLGEKRSGLDNIFYTKCLWVDIDAPEKDLPAEDRQKAAKVLLDKCVERLKAYNLEPSYIVASGHGFHVYLILKIVYLAPIDRWQAMENALIALASGDSQAKDPARLLRMPGTVNLKDKNNAQEVGIIAASGKIYYEKDFQGIIKDFGEKPSEKKGASPSNRKPLGFMPPCIKHLLDPANKPPMGYRHLVRRVLATYGYHEGWPVEDTVAKVTHTSDSPQKAEQDVKGVYAVLERDPDRYSVGCGEGSAIKTLIDNGVTVCDRKNCQFAQHDEEKEDEPEKLTHSAWFDGLVDIVRHDKAICFLVKDGKTLIVKKMHETPNGKLVPPPEEAILWSLPEASKVFHAIKHDSDSTLFEDLTSYYRDISELPGEAYYKYLAAWTMHSYLTEKSEYSPILWFYGVAARGKTRTGKGIIYAAWRGVHMVTLREAHLIRLAQDHRATLFFDISDIWKKAEAAGVDDVLLNRFERGATIARVLYPDKGAFMDTVYYRIFGGTIIGSNEPATDILETRAVQIIPPETARIFEEDIKPEQGLPFRERLVAFRARWMDRDLPSVEKPVTGRLGDILRPIRQIVRLACNDETWFVEFAKEIFNRRKADMADSIEAQVVKAIYEAKNKVIHGHLLHQDYLPIINRDRPERFHFSAQKIGRITAKLGFDRYSNGSRGIYFDEKLLEQLCERYGVTQSSTMI